MPSLSAAAPRAQVRVAAIVPTWQKAGDAMEAVASLRAGSVPPSSIVILDNGSGDGTVEILRRGTAELPEVDVLGFEENLGFSRAVNVGVCRALEEGATHVLLMNDDAVVEPETVSRLCDALAEEPTAGMAAPRIFYHGDPERVWQGEGHYSWLRTGVVSPEKNRPIGECDRRRRLVTFATGCVLLVRREVFERVGLLEELLYFYEEDVEFALRAGDAGYGTVYVPDAVAYHKIENVAQDRSTPFVLYHLARSRVLRLRLAGGFELMYGLLVHVLAFTPFRLWQVSRGSRSRQAAAAWLRGTKHGLMHRFGDG